jgi:hypothetical protein
MLTLLRETRYMVLKWLVETSLGDAWDREGPALPSSLWNRRSHHVLSRLKTRNLMRKTSISFSLSVGLLIKASYVSSQLLLWGAVWQRARLTKEGLNFYSWENYHYSQSIIGFFSSDITSYLRDVPLYKQSARLFLSSFQSANVTPSSKLEVEQPP